MSKPEHRRQVCGHGDVVMQCRCVGPKVEQVVACPTRCLTKHGEMLPVGGGSNYVGRHRAPQTEDDKMIA